MAITGGSDIEITMSMLFDSQICMNVWQYNVTAASVVTNPAQYAEAWWDHVKATYRALIVTGAGAPFQSVIIRELNNPTGDLGEFAIPPSEQDGTRSAGSLGSFLAGFAAVGVRLSVASRATRPGQKRILGLTEGDVSGPLVGAGFVALVDSLMNVMTNPLVLGAPAVGAVFEPIVVRKDATGAVTASQPVTGYVVDTVVTTQVSRRVGRGI